MFKKTLTIATVALIPALLLTGCGEKETKTSNPVASSASATPTVTPTPTPVFTPMNAEESKAAYASILAASIAKMDAEGMTDESETMIVAFDRSFTNIMPDANIAAYFTKTDNTYHLIWEGEGVAFWYLDAALKTAPEGVVAVQTSADTYLINNPAFDAITSSYTASDIVITVKDGVIVGTSSLDGTKKSVITYGNVKADEILTAAAATK